MEYLEVTGQPSPTPLPVESTAVLSLKTLTSPTQIPFSFDTEKVYYHPQGLFDFPLPEDWRIVREDGGSVEFANSEVEASFHVFATNTGVPLDRESFTHFVEAQETNFFSVFSGNIETNHYYDKDGIGAVVVKNLLFEGEVQQVASLYKQAGQAVLTLHLWVDSPLMTSYIPFFIQFFNEIQLNLMKIAEQPVYRWVYEFHDEFNSYTLLVPLQWKNERVTSSPAQVNRFIAPDQNGSIQITLFDDGEWISGQEAGFLTLELLKKDYGNNLSILDDRFLEGGFERLTWEIRDGETSGFTFFDCKNSSLIIITMDYTTNMEVFYQDLYQDLTSSFHYLEP